MPGYEFLEDYEELREDFLQRKHALQAGPGSKNISATITLAQYNRVKMISLIFGESLSKTVALVLNAGCTDVEEGLMDAAKRETMVEVMKKIEEKDLPF